MNSDSQSRSSGLGLKAIALVAVLVGSWILFKVAIGVVTTVAWIIVIVLAVMAVLWAMSVLRR